DLLASLLVYYDSAHCISCGSSVLMTSSVSSTSPMRQHDIRRAIGPLRGHVLLQFLTEAVLLSAAGGAAGIVVGVGVSEVLSAVAGWPTLVSPAAIVGGFVFSAAVGVFFGYYPARKAAHLDSTEALRYE